MQTLAMIELNSVAKTWQRKLFPVVTRRVLDEDGSPTSQKESFAPRLPEICMDLRDACDGSADPWDTPFLTEVLEMLRAIVVGWRHTDDPFDQAVLQMVRRTIEIGEWELASRENVTKVAFLKGAIDASSVVRKLKDCVDQRYGHIVLREDQCKKLLDLIAGEQHDNS